MCTRRASHTPPALTTALTSLSRLEPEDVPDRRRSGRADVVRATRTGIDL